MNQATTALTCSGTFLARSMQKVIMLVDLPLLLVTNDEVWKPHHGSSRGRCRPASDSAVSAMFGFQDRLSFS